MVTLPTTPGQGGKAGVVISKGLGEKGGERGGRRGGRKRERKGRRRQPRRPPEKNDEGRTLSPLLKARTTTESFELE